MTLLYKSASALTQTRVWVNVLITQICISVNPNSYCLGKCSDCPTEYSNYLYLVCGLNYPHTNNYSPSLWIQSFNYPETNNNPLSLWIELSTNQQITSNIFTTWENIKCSQYPCTMRHLSSKSLHLLRVCLIPPLILWKQSFLLYKTPTKCEYAKYTHKKT